jgi:hypothetical protein
MDSITSAKYRSMPSCWEILSNDGTTVTAYNSKLQESFSGTAAAFKDKLTKAATASQSGASFKVDDSGNIVDVVSASGNPAMMLTAQLDSNGNPTGGIMANAHVFTTDSAYLNTNLDGTIVAPTKTIPTISAPEAISSNYKFWITGLQATGSGNARDLTAHSTAGLAIAPTTNLSDANAWGTNTGWMTCLTNATALDGFKLSKTDWNPDISVNSMILAFNLKMANTGANTIIIGQGDSSHTGIYLQARSTGAISIGFRDSLGNVDVNVSNSVAVVDGTEHSVMFAVDAVTKVTAIYIDGVLDSTFLNSNLIGSTTSAYNFVVGGASVTTTSSTAMQIRYVHGLTFTGGLPTNLGIIAAKLKSFPRYPLLSTDLDFSLGRKRVVAIVGQSNESGAATTFRKTNLYGCPNADITSVTGGSWWPLMAEALFAKTSAYTYVLHYTAKGSTSIVANWCGTSTGTNTGTVYSKADAGFDPNNYLRTSATSVKVLLDAAIGFDEKWVFLSIGQQDASLNTTRAQFALGYQNVIDYLLSNGYKVAVGFTFYAPVYDTWYSTIGNLAIADVLTYYTGNQNVISGANLYATLGTAVSMPLGNVHGDDRAYDMAAIAWVNTLNPQGW